MRLIIEAASDTPRSLGLPQSGLLSCDQQRGNCSLLRTGQVALGSIDCSASDLVAAAARFAWLTRWENANADACALWCIMDPLERAAPGGHASAARWPGLAAGSWCDGHV